MEYKTVIGYRKPLELETGVTTVYFRKDIREIEDDYGNQAWQYEEAQMSLAEYKAYLSWFLSPNKTPEPEPDEKEPISLSEYRERLNKVFPENSEAQEQILNEFFLNQATIALETEYQTCLMELNSAM